MRNNQLFRWFYVFVLISFFFLTCSDGKGFGGRGGGGGFRGGSRGSGSFGGSKGAGTFGGSYGRSGGYNNMGKPYRSGSSFKGNAMSFGAGMLGGVAAYSLMRSMSHSYRPGYYDSGYGYGDTCYNSENLNGTRFGSFRCPLNGFPYEAKSCCGDYGKQFCCIPESTSRFSRGASNFGLIFLIVIFCLIGICFLVRHLQRRQKGVVLVPVEPPPNEPQGQPFYQPQPPPMGYPPVPPMGYPPVPPMGNPYGIPPQTYEGNYNPYLPQQHPPNQMPYPPQQQSYNPYYVKEGGPPAYDDAMRNNQGMPAMKQM